MYKIIKYFYLLIALGFTDIAHHFHPVAFMFTSNETGADYDHFFESSIETCTQNYVVFDSRFMVSDAARAILNSIKKAFPDCQYSMCWFHLKMNGR